VTIGEAVTDYTPTWVDVGPETDAPALALAQNAPNPTRDATTIGFRTPVAARVTIRVYDLAGRARLTLLDRDLPAGVHSIPVDTSELRAGAYFYELRAGDRSIAKKMLLVR
jgi:hypothetical protein